jgi:hypothetical protein
MLGSQPREFVAAPMTPSESIYAVKLGGNTLWGWVRRGPEGVLLASSETLFMDYMSCFCDARRGIDPN